MSAHYLLAGLSVATEDWMLCATAQDTEGGMNWAVMRGLAIDARRNGARSFEILEALEEGIIKAGEDAKQIYTPDAVAWITGDENND